MIVRLTTIETSSETLRARLSDWKNWPITPRTNASGRKTRIVVKVEPTTAPLISRLARSTAASPVWPSARCRAMFSITTTVSSMIRPMATASPPSDIRLSVSPVRWRKTKLMIRLSGIAERGDQRRPEALEEQQQDDDAEQAADDDGVADVGDGRADEQPLIVDRLGSCTPGGAVFAASASTSSSVAETARALPPRRRKTVRATASLPLRPDRHRPVLVRRSSPGPGRGAGSTGRSSRTITRSSRSSGSVASVSART